MKFVTPIDLNTLELQNAVLHKLGTAPTGVEGRMYYNSTTDNKRPYIHNGTEFKGLAYTDETLNKSLCTATGDIFYASSTGNPATLNRGSNGQILKLVAGLPSWQNEYSYTLPLAASGTRGGIQVGYTTSGKNYAVQLDNEKAYVNVPWTDTTYENKTAASGGTALSLVTTGEKYTWNAKQNAISDVTDSVNGYVSKVTQTNGQIAITHASFTTPTIAWTAGTTAGPKLKITTDGGTSSEVAIPSAGASASGIVTTDTQTFAGAKTFSSAITASGGVKIAVGNQLKLYGGNADVNNSYIIPFMEYDATNHAIHFSCAVYSDYEITAGGVGSGGSGGGGGLISTCKKYSDFSLTASDFDDTLTSETFNAYSINWLYSQLVPFKNSKANANGLASLDATGKIPLTQIPDAILGQLLYGGTVNASGVATLSTNVKNKLGISSDTVTLTNGTDTYGFGSFEGVYFIMSADSSFASLPLRVGDWLISTGSAWKKIDNTDAVTSVVGQTGTITTAQIATALTGAGYKLTDTDTDTKNTAGSTQSTSKLYLIGATSQGDNPQTYSNANVYAENGSIFASKFNNLTLTAATTGFTITGGSTTSKTLTVNKSYTLGAACAKGVATSVTSSSTDLATSKAVYDYAAPKSLCHSYSISGSSITSYTTTYDFTTNNLVATLYNSSDEVVMADTKIIKSGTSYAVNVSFAAAIGSSTYRLVVIGI